MRYLNSATKEQLRSFRGKQSKVAGEMFENMISAACEYYKEQNIAYIEKTPEAFRVTGKKKTSYGLTFEGIFTKKCQPDFKGTLNGGQAICFEAKHTDDEEIKQNRLTDEQMKSLDLHQKLGAKAYVLVSLKMNDFYMVPWTAWKDMKNIYGRKDMKISDLKPYKVPYERCVIKFLNKAVEKNINLT